MELCTTASTRAGSTAPGCCRCWPACRCPLPGRAPGEPDITIVTDAGYDVTRLARVLQDLPVELVGRVRGDRAMRLPKPPRVYDPRGGRPSEHGPEFRFAKPRGVRGASARRRGRARRPHRRRPSPRCSGSRMPSA
ncbi:transposase [Streptomyces cirratus]|uniref:transposase n=1 Tax=Streptomyces cirratus TaxID=68187 RepID=UPI00360BD73F